MSDIDESGEPKRFKWTPGRVMLGELALLGLAILVLVPITFVGVALTGVPEDSARWWINIYTGDILVIGLTILSIPLTGFVWFVAWLARDK
jgi:hypothetical protein